MANQYNLKTFPFTVKHFVKFNRELKQAKNFENLMRKKQALENAKGMAYITTYPNIEDYKNRFLIGTYATLRPFYDTEMPYIFWSDLYRFYVKLFDTDEKNSF